MQLASSSRSPRKESLPQSKRCDVQERQGAGARQGDPERGAAGHPLAPEQHRGGQREDRDRGRQDRRVDCGREEQAEDEEDLVEGDPEQSVEEQAASIGGADRFADVRAADGSSISAAATTRNAAKRKGGIDARASLPKIGKEGEADLRPGQGESGSAAGAAARALTRRAAASRRRSRRVRPGPQRRRRRRRRGTRGRGRSGRTAARRRRCVTRPSSRLGFSGSVNAVPAATAPSGKRKPTSRRFTRPYVRRRATISWPT